MKKKCSPINNLKYNSNNFFKKIELNKDLKSFSKKNIFTKNDLKTYNVISSKGKKNINFIYDIPKEKVTKEINNSKDLNIIKLIRLERNKMPRNVNTSGNESARFLSGSPINFQPILTEISNMNNNSQNNNIEKNKNTNNDNDYYKNLYLKTKNINNKLLIKINDLFQKNINYEKIFSKLKIERNNLLMKIKDLEKIINQNGNNENLNDLSLENKERNKIIMENQKLKNDINKILKDNNELKKRIQSIEKNSFNISNDKISNTKNYIQINNTNNAFHPLIKNNSFNP